MSILFRDLVDRWLEVICETPATPFLLDEVDRGEDARLDGASFNESLLLKIPYFGVEPCLLFLRDSIVGYRRQRLVIVDCERKS